MPMPRPVARGATAPAPDTLAANGRARFGPPPRALMTDYFALLGEPRRPWLEPDSLKARFLALSAEAHPDRLHNAPEAQKQAANQQYAELNSAYRCLREPKERLQHLLELELRSKPEAVRPIAEATMGLS